MHRALVTGASRGIGEQIADVLRRQGIDVLAPARQELDLLDGRSIEAFIALHDHDGIDILVNNAGINIINPIEAVTAADWERMIQVNLTAPFLLIQGLSPAMREAGWGRIVNISSIWSIVTKEGRAPYSATKSAINGLTRTAAVELAPHGVLVNAVCPGYVETELTRTNNSPEELAAISRTIPLGRLAQPRRSPGSSPFSARKTIAI